MKSSSTSSSESRRRSWRTEIVALASGLLALWVLEYYTLPGAWNTPTAEVLFVGTSRTANAIDPAEFERPIGQVTFYASDIDLLSASLLRHLDRWSRLEVVVIEISDFTLLTDRVREGFSDLGPIVGELHLWSIALPNREPRFERWLWKLNNLLDGKGTPGLYYRRRPTLERLLTRERSEAPFAKANDPTAPGRTLDQDAGKARLSFISHRTGGSVEPNLSALENLVSVLTDRGIAVVLVGYPEHEELARLRPESWEKVIEKGLERGHQAAAAELPWLDYRRTHDMSDSAFRDIEHLNPRGAAEFSERLALELKRIRETPNSPSSP